MKEPD
jgi:multiple antibiotic resistance protein